MTMIGTAPNQVPTNGDLGTMAFQDKNAVSIGGGYADNFKSISFPRINTSYPNISAIDVFVYDTKKDSDGGNWRLNCQDKSWYNEPLNTAIRGNRREFPAVAVIVAETSKVTIFDADADSLGMWMVFNRPSSTVATCLWPWNNVVPTKICAINGVIAMASTGSSRISILDMLGEKAYVQGTAANSIRNISIADRDASVTGWSPTDATTYIPSHEIYYVDYFVFPGAAINKYSGLPIPTFAISTSVGSAIIREFYKVIKITGNISGAETLDNFACFDKDGSLWITDRGISSGGHYMAGFKYLPFTDVAITDGEYRIGSNMSSLVVSSNLYLRGFIKSFTDVAIGGIGSAGVDTSCLNMISFDKENISRSMYGFIATNYNTGWMFTDPKGSYICGKSQGILNGTELITNGTFTTDTTGWTGINGATLSVASSQLVVTCSAGDSTGAASQAITTVPGKYYTVSLSAIGGTAAAYKVHAGTSQNGSELFDSGAISLSVYNYTFLATTTTTYITLKCWGAVSQTRIWDNVVCRLAEPDRSNIKVGLQVFGSLQSTSVSSDTELSSISGFNSGNYLSLPNAPCSFGTGDFTIKLWARYTTDTNTQQALICYGTPGLNNGFLLNFDLSANLVDCGYLSGTFLSSITQFPQVNKWTMITAVRSGGRLQIYLNADKINEGTDSVNWSTLWTNPSLYIGVRADGSSNATATEIALVSISGVAASSSQLAKIYNDEKQLFEPNAKCMLYGTSDDITGLDYDEVTGLVYAGTSSGSSVFSRLCRISDKSDPVSAAISASGGIVIEE